jgi:hypothetical protein
LCAFLSDIISLTISVRLRLSQTNSNFDKTKTKVRQIIFLLILKRKVFDRLPSDFRKNFTTWKTCEVMIEIVYKKMHRSSRLRVITAQRNYFH